MKKIQTIILALMAVIMLHAPTTLLAEQVGAEDTKTSPSTSSTILLKNPLGEANSDPRVIVGNVIKLVLGLIGSLSLLIFMYGGLTWMTSGGNSDKVKSGRDTLMWATIGLLVIFSSYTLVTYVITKIAQQ